LAALGDGHPHGRGDDPVVDAGLSAAEAAVLREWLTTLTH
jgi:hypothetical protein